MNWFLSWITLINIWLIHWILTSETWWWFLIIVATFTLMMMKKIFTKLRWYKMGIGLLMTMVIVGHSITQKKSFSQATSIVQTKQQKMTVKAKYANFYIMSDQRKTNYQLNRYYYWKRQKRELKLEINDQMQFCYRGQNKMNPAQEKWLWIQFQTKKRIILDHQKCSPKINPSKTWRNQLKKFLIQDNLKNNQNWIKFLIFQETERDFQETKGIMSQMGIIHLFVVSGFHLIILTKIWFGIAKYSKQKIGRTGLEMIGLVCALFLVYLTNWKFSALKAFIFILGNWIITTIGGTKSNKKEQIAFLILSFFLFNPWIIYQIGFQLSCLASWILFTKNENTHKLLNYKQKLWQLVQKNSIVIALLLPIIINIQHQISLFVVFYSLIYGLMVTILYPLIFLGIWWKSIWPWWSIIFAGLQKSLFWIKSFDILIPFGQWSQATISVYYCIFIVLSILTKRWHWKILLIIFWIGSFVLITISNWEQRYYQLHLINVGHGLAMFLQGPNKQTNILFDAGIGKEKINNSNRINRYLKKMAVNHLDAVFISHHHSDHYNNLMFLKKQINIKKMFFNRQQKSYYQIDDLRFHNWAFNYYQKMEEENNKSLVLYTQINNHKLLMTFDLEKKGETMLLKQTKVKPVDVLQVGHHGAKNASSMVFLQAINPRYCLISSNQKQPKAIVNLNKTSCQTFNTKNKNNIVVTFSPQIQIHWN